MSRENLTRPCRYQVVFAVVKDPVPAEVDVSNAEPLVVARSHRLTMRRPLLAEVYDFRPDLSERVVDDGSDGVAVCP